MSKKKRLAAIALSACMLGSVGFIAACGDGDDDANGATYNTYTTVMPSNWNELTYEDNNDTQILYNIVSSFFEYDYDFVGGKFKEDGSINVEGINPEGFAVKYSAATKLEDVTDEVDAKWGYTAAQKEAGGYAWKITLRNDITWDDGTPIDATDFVYSMEQQLDPLFKNMRASTYYNNIQIKNARNYVFSNDKMVYDNVAQHFASNAAAEAAGYDVLLDMWNLWGLSGAEKVLTYDLEKETYTTDPETTCPQYVEFDDETLWLDPAYFTAMDEYESLMDAYEDAVANGETPNKPEKPVLAEYIVSAKMIVETLGEANLDATGAYKSYVYIYIENEDYGFKFENVGIYSPSQYELVVCLDNPIQCLKEDGSLSYEAAYSFASLPLVKEDLYEECKQEPQTGSELWTTNYNSSVETSASWGPYKLVEFQSGKSYRLERNDNWFGYDLDDNAGQYLVDAIECEQIASVETQWMQFFAGNLDEIAIDLDHKSEYGNSKYASYTPGTGTFGLNLLSNVDYLKNSGHNSGILAIPEFRKAISLSINRDDYNASTTTAHQSCYGLLGPSYYYDIENASTLEDGGVYRNTQYAKETLLRVYGFTENADGSWTDGTRTYEDYEAAYEVMNGYNPTQAKELVEEAYEELTKNAETYGYDSGKKITFVYGTAADNVGTRRDYEYIKNVIETMVEDTPLEDQINVTFDASFGSGWATDFQSGAYEIASGVGYSGGAFDPAGFLQCYVDPYAGLMFNPWWNTQTYSLTFTMPEVDDGTTYPGEGQEMTMSLFNWYCCLNGIAESYGQTEKYNWGAGAIPEEARLQLTARLEEEVLEQYTSIMTTSQYTASLQGAQFSNICDEYNVFMGYGGYRYMQVNYTNGEWAEYVASTNLETEYKTARQ